MEGDDISIVKKLYSVSLAEVVMRKDWRMEWEMYLFKVQIVFFFLKQEC